MSDEKTADNNLNSSISKSTEKNKSNLWVGVSIFLGVAVLILSFMILRGGITGNAIKGDDAGQNLVNFAETQGISLIINNISDEGSFYAISYTIDGKDSTSYVTKDGEYLISPLAQLTGEAVGNTNADTNTQATEVPKSDKPVVELFVMSYCPYGTQAEKGIIPAIEALGNKIDFKLRFVDYAMHEKKEIDENVRQYCIQKEQSTKLLSYLKCFLKEGKSDSCLTEVGIDSTKLNSCVSSTDSQFKITSGYNDKSNWPTGQYPPFDIDKSLNDNYGVQGSPTLIINGVQSDAGRDSASYLKGICAAFNTAPAECENQLSSTSSSPGFGYATTSGSTVSDTQCG